MSNEAERMRPYIVPFLQGKGIFPYRPFKCLNPQHPDAHPSMSLNRNTWQVHCFSCGATYDLFDLIGIEYGLKDYAEQVRKAREIYLPGATTTLPLQGSFTGSEADGGENTADPEPDLANYAAYFDECAARINQTAYHRGMRPETLHLFHIGYDPAWRHPHAPANVPATPRLIIPTGPCSYLARDTRREIPEAQRAYVKQKVGRQGFFNIDALKSKEPVFVTEGELDAAAVCDAGGNAVALGTVSRVRQFADIAAKMHPAGPLILLLDNDDAGKEASRRLSGELQERGIRFMEPSRRLPFKDPSEALQRDRTALEAYLMDNLTAANKNANLGPNLSESGYTHKATHKTAQKGTQEYTHKSVSYMLPGLMATLAANGKYIPTGFKELDRKLDGGLYAGLIVLGAISSLGKTTLALQICDQIADSGHDVLFFSLEMPCYKLMSKSISRYTRHIDLRDNGTTEHAMSMHDLYRAATAQADPCGIIEKSIAEYQKAAAHVYLIEGASGTTAANIRGRIREHVEETGCRPVVIVDYLQRITATGNAARGTDKQAIDSNLDALAQITRDFNIPLIAISSFNRDSYMQPVEMSSFKESGGVEYTADVLLGMQYAGMDYRPNESTSARNNRVISLLRTQHDLAVQGDPQKIEIKILKYRDCQQDSVNLNFFPRFSAFEDAEGETNGNADGWESVK